MHRLKEDEEFSVFIQCIIFPVTWLPEVKVVNREVREDKAERAAVSLEGTSRSRVAGEDFSGSLWDSDGCDRQRHTKKRSEMDKSNHFVPFLEVWDSSEKLPELIQSVLTQLLMMWNPINVSVHFKYQRTGFSHILFKAIKMEMTKVWTFQSFTLMNQWIFLLLSK